jgi:hypothetical protein
MQRFFDEVDKATIEVGCLASTALENLGRSPFQCSPQPPRHATLALTQEETSRRWTYGDADAQLSPESRTAALKRLYYKQAQDWEVYVNGEMPTPFVEKARRRCVFHPSLHF